MAGIPKIPLYEQYPVKVQAVTVVDDDQRARLAREGVDVIADAPAVGHMDTVLTLNTHIGTHIDAPRHFLADGGPVDELPLDRLVMRDAVVLDVSGKPAGAGISGDDLERTGVVPAPGQIAVIKTLWTDRAWGRPEFWNDDHPSRAERERVDRRPRRGGGRHGLFPGEAVLAHDARAGRARRQPQAVAQSRDSDDPASHQPRRASATASSWWRCRCGCVAWTARPPAWWASRTDWQRCGSCRGVIQLSRPGTNRSEKRVGGGS